MRKYLGRINDSSLHHVNEYAVESVVASVGVVGLDDLVDNDRSIHASVLGDLKHGLNERVPDDLDTLLLVLICDGDIVKAIEASDKSGATAGNNALFDGSAGGAKSVIDAVFFLVHLDFRGAADLQDCNARAHPGHPLLHLFLLVLRGGLLDGGPDLVNASIDVLLLALPLEEKSVVLGDGDFADLAEIVELDVFELDVSRLGAEDQAAGRDGHVLEGVLPVVSKAWGLDSDNLEADLEPVDDQGGQSLAIDVLGNDDERSLVLMKK